MSHKLYKLCVVRYWFNGQWNVARKIKPAFLVYNSLLNRYDVITRADRRGTHIHYLEV